MPRPTPAPVVSDKLQLYEKLVATNPSVKRKGATVPYTSLNGHMLSYVSKEGKLALRLPPDQREVFLKKYNAKRREAYGVVQAEYVEVPASLLSSTRELKKFVDAVIATLPLSNRSLPQEKRNFELSSISLHGSAIARWFPKFQSAVVISRTRP